MLFDQALPAIVQLALTVFGPDVVNAGLFLRDASGRVTFVSRSVDSVRRATFEAESRRVLGEYVDLPFATPEELFEPELHEKGGALSEVVVIGDERVSVRLIDRRIVGQDWSRPNFVSASPRTPIISFFSCKGGVGRSTALAVAAAGLSDRGKNVLVVDFDIEAPGIGSILLPEAELPRFGAIDYFVESTFGPLESEFIESCIAPSPLTAGKGLVEVLPATGQVARRNPQNVIPKIGRVFIDRTIDHAAFGSFLDQTRHLVSILGARKRTDAILVDVRAGLSESAAASVLGLGGDILMFGVDTPQTFESYDYLFSHLGRFAQQASVEFDWRYRLRMVHAKARRGTESYKSFRDSAQLLFEKYLYEEAGPDDLAAFNFDIDDPQAPHYAWPIPYDAEYSEFDPPARREQLSRDFADRSFGPFVDNVARLLEPRDS